MEESENLEIEQRLTNECLAFSELDAAQYELESSVLQESDLDSIQQTLENHLLMESLHSFYELQKKN